MRRGNGSTKREPVASSFPSQNFLPARECWFEPSLRHYDRDMTSLRKRRRALLVVLGLTSLVVLTVLVYAARFDLDSWKSEIEAAASTGARMHVTIQGTLERKRWFPLTVVVRGLQFQNRDEPVVTLDNVECSSLELIPLMRRRLRMGTCTVDGFAIAIVRGADGHFNFERTTPHPRPLPGADSAPPALLVSRLIPRL